MAGFIISSSTLVVWKVLQYFVVFDIFPVYYLLNQCHVAKRVV